MNSKKIKWNIQTTQDNSVMVRKYTYQNVRGSLERKINCLRRGILITTFKSVFSVKKVKMMQKHHMRSDRRN